jgi:signal transduction histidine kinase
VSKDQLPRLFTPFFRSDTSRARVSGGVGLGLPVCLGVAGAHGGDLTAA